MFKKRKDIPIIQSLGDLQDERAKKIAEEYSLDVKEILPRYLELTKEVMANNGQIEIDIDDSTIPINILNEYRRKLACGVVISYELATRESIKFPVAEEPAVVGVGKEAFLMSIKVKGSIHRTVPIQVYEQIGQYYEQVIDLLDKHQKINLEKIVRE